MMEGERSYYKAAGKVMIAGGYGVLEEGNYALTLALDRHFYSVTTASQGSVDPKEGIEVTVSSPQIGAKWLYRYNQ
jgi:phosphomevalonate kinase